MRALVTGANGFIGSHLADTLLAKGWEVRCLVRRKSNRRWLLGKDMELLECDDVTAVDVARQAVRQVDVVFHVLGTLVASTLEQYRQVNVTPVRVFLNACESEGNLKRFVLVSSQGASGPNRGPNGRMSESDPCHPVSAYGRSKLEAEEVAGQYEGRVPITIVRPSAMYGPRDVNFLKLFRSAHRRGKLPQVGGQPKSLCLAHVHDIVEGTFLSAVCDSALNKTYFLASEEICTYQDVLAAMERAVAKPVRLAVVPDWAVRGMMWYADILRWFGKDILLNRDRLTTLSYPRWVCDVSRARADFGYRQSISLADGFCGTYQWYLKEGWL
jgi:dihydroflavonol-4-reductase